MSPEKELLRLAREREGQTEEELTRMVLGKPHILGRHLRDYLARQADRRRIRRSNEKIPQLTTVRDGLNELACPELDFLSGTRLEFKIQLLEDQRGWLVTRFYFHVHLPQPRTVSMVRIHLNDGASHDPLAVPRCHLHIGNSRAHVPFPITHPRLILHLICEHIEPDFGS